MDEYDTPMQEAWVRGYWNRLVSLTRSLFNSTFKTNLWSIINYLDTGNLESYWANSSNGLIGKLIREGMHPIKDSFGVLLTGGAIRCSIDEQIVYNQLRGREEAVWSLLLAGGYLKVVSYHGYEEIAPG